MCKMSLSKIKADHEAEGISIGVEDNQLYAEIRDPAHPSSTQNIHTHPAAPVTPGLTSNGYEDVALKSGGNYQFTHCEAYEL